VNKKASVGLLLFPVTCYAEVSDKIPTIVGMWSTSLVLGIIFFLVSLRYKFAPVLAIFISFLLAYSFYDMYVDTSFREAVVMEQGGNYFLNGYASSIVVFIFSILGRFFHNKTRR